MSAEGHKRFILTIITVVLNDQEKIEKTIKSIIKHKPENVEYIVIDGQSSDNTVSILSKYKHHINCLVSEPDSGIYNAMNKGVALAHGENLLFINSGDYIVGDLINDLKKSPCFLPVKFMNVQGKLRTMKVKSHKLGLPYGHQGIIFNNKNLRYSEDYKISSDYDYYLRHGYKQLPMIKSNGYIYYDNNGISSKFRYIRDKEISKIIGNHFGNFYRIRFEIYFRLKNFLRKIISK